MTPDDCTPPEGREVRFTERELDIMDVLWTRGSGTVAEVLERLEDELAYTTVLTILRTLEEKGHVRHEREGRAHRYHPCVGRERAGESAVRRLLRGLFRGDPELLLTQLVSSRALSEDELRRLRDLLEERLGGEAQGERDAKRGERGEAAEKGGAP